MSSILSITNMKLLQDFTMSLAHPSFWGSNSLLSALGGEWGCWKKAVQAVNVRNFSLDTSVLSTPSPKTEHLLPLSCLCSQIFVLVLKKIPNIKLHNKSLHSSTGNSKCHSTQTYFLNNLTASAGNNDVNTSISAFSVMIKAMPVTIKVTIW